MSSRTLQDLIQATRQFSVEDPSQSQRLFWTAVLVWIGFLGMAASPLPYPIRLLAGVLAGLTTVRLFIFYHDFLHDAIFRNSPFMKKVMWAYGILILNPPTIWKRSHNYHHQSNAQIATASIGSFPVMTTAQYNSASFLQKLLYRFVRSPLNIACGYLTIFVLGMCVKSAFADPRKHWDSILALVLHATLLAVVTWVGGLSLLIFLVLVPLVVAHALGAYLFYIQHNFPGMQLRSRTEWDYLFAALYSSSFMDGGRLTHWFTGNIGYHHIHHLNARIPFYRLPQTMKEIPELQSPMRTTLHPTDIYRCFQLKLWHAGLGTMTGFPSLLDDWKSRKAHLSVS